MLRRVLEALLIFGRGAAWFRYGFAALAVLVTFCARLSLEPLLFEHSPMLLFTVPVAVTAMVAGCGPSLAATAGSALASTYFFPPYGVFGIWPEHVRVGVFQIALFLGAGLLMSALGGQLQARRSERETLLQSLRATLAERDAALEKVRVLSGFLPICAGCKSIRDRDGDWHQMESYIAAHSDAQFSHGLCPTCAARYLSELEASGMPPQGPVSQ